MITGELKNKIDGLWDIFAAGGLVNPLDVIEQITYLMFIHDLDDSDNLKAKESAMLGLPYKSIFADEVTIGDRKVDGRQLKWSVFRDFPAGKMYAVVQEQVFPFIKTLHGDKNSAYSKYMGDAIFKLPTPLLLSKVVDSLDTIYTLIAQGGGDLRGDTYEYLLSKIAQSGLNGQFRTPRHIIRMMVDMMAPTPDDTICDPACGTSGFLLTAGEYLKENHKDLFFDRVKKDHYMNHMFHGYDMDRTMLRIGAMNMMVHGVDNPYIEYRDSLSDQNPDKDKYSLVLANPPFKGSLDADTVSTDLLKVCSTKKTELLFLALFLRMMKVGGRCACIVPDGVLFGSSKAHQAIRKAIVEENRLQAVISMPSGVFKPYAGVSTAVLVFTKTNHGGTDKVWFYDMKADGFSLDDKRTQIADNDIPDIVSRFHNLAEEENRARTEQSFLVPKQEIVDNAYDLSVNKYKKVEQKKVEYPPTSEILANIRKLEQKTRKDTQKLERMLNIGESEEKYDIQIMYDEACAFFDCAEMCMKPEDAHFMGYSTPHIVNTAFACELFLKALHNYHRTEIGKLHELKELFDALPNDSKASIKYLTQQGTICVDVWGQDKLELVSNAFEDWRYYYEIFPKQSMSCEIGFMTVFCKALREQCSKEFWGLPYKDYMLKTRGKVVE